MHNSGWGLCSVASSTEEEIRTPLEQEAGLDLEIEMVSSLDDVVTAATEDVRTALAGGGRDGTVGQAEDLTMVMGVQGVYQVGVAAMTKVWATYGGQEAAAMPVPPGQVAVVATMALMCGSREQVSTAMAGVASLDQTESPVADSLIGADNLKEKTREALPSGSKKNAGSQAAMAKGSGAVEAVNSVGTEVVVPDAATIDGSEAMAVSHLGGKAAADADLRVMGALYEVAPLDLSSAGSFSMLDVAETLRRTATVGVGAWETVPAGGRARHGTIRVGKLANTVIGGVGCSGGYYAALGDDV